MELERCLKRGRRARKLTQRDVAEMAGIAIQDFIKLESGIFAYVDEESLRRLAYAIGADDRLLLLMYRSEFHDEIKASQKAQTPSIQDDKGIAGKSLTPELIGLVKTIMTLPVDAEEILIKKIRILIQAQEIECRSRAV